jgi:seryl-tRNA synthetase
VKSQTSLYTFRPFRIAEKNRLLDLPRGAKISGSGFPVYTGIGAIWERALINFMLNFHIQKHNYTELAVPVLVTRKTMTGTDNCLNWKMICTELKQMTFSSSYCRSSRY